MTLPPRTVVFTDGKAWWVGVPGSAATSYTVVFEDEANAVVTPSP